MVLHYEVIACPRRSKGMGWRDRLLRLMMRGALIPQGAHLDAEKAIRALDRIAADEEATARLDRLDEAGVRDAFLAYYHRELSRSNGAEED